MVATITAITTTPHASHPDPDITEKLRALQSRIQVWIKPTDRILTDADAYEYDCFRADRTSDHISFNWGLALLLFSSLSTAVTYYTCLLLASGRINAYLAANKGDKEAVFLNELASVVAFHLVAFPAVAAVLGNRRVRRVCAVVVIYCLLALGLAGAWWWVVARDAARGGAMPGRMFCLGLRPFGIAIADSVGSVANSDPV
ncbi:hypothetical protein DRE_07234 [Drechslerella stenobrocha 248]|uniref:Uncharacterized protein n=1 Tax=Drechslerella stenobrocha 248 TaxID=1043628 RepID=W7HUX7_9PEZI|nr:hypothetical protein DRE_07234 [Drechslerella stenobrocha 248]